MHVWQCPHHYMEVDTFYEKCTVLPVVNIQYVTTQLLQLMFFLVPFYMYCQSKSCVKFAQRRVLAERVRNLYRPPLTIAPGSASVPGTPSFSANVKVGTHSTPSLPHPNPASTCQRTGGPPRDPPEISGEKGIIKWNLCRGYVN